MSETDMNASDDSKPVDPAVKVLEQHVLLLSEHFDSVQIICTKHEFHGGDKEMSSARIERGCGCFYSRLGAVKEWVLEMDELTRERVRGGGSEDEDA